MSGAVKDQRSRHNRRGSRRVHRELAEVATQVAQAAVDFEVGEEQMPAATPIVSSPVTKGACGSWEQPLFSTTPSDIQEPGVLQTIEESKFLVSRSPGSVTHSPGPSILRSLPTPVRGQASPKALLFFPDGMEPQGLPTGPTDIAGARMAEPWVLPDSVPQQQQQQQQQPQQPQQKGGYREWLQARGQDAMHRCGVQGRPNVSAGVTSDCSGSPQGGSMPFSTAWQQQPMTPINGQQATMGSPQHMASWNGPMTHNVPMQQWFGTGGLEVSTMMAGGSSPQAGLMADAYGCQQGGPMPFGSACQQQPMTPMNGQQVTPLSYAACQQGPATPMSSSPQASLSYFGCQQDMATPVGAQQAPVSFFGCQPEPATPASGQPLMFSTSGHQTPATPQLPTASGDGSKSMEDIMATVMGPEASFLDREQIAEQLRAAAPCCYDD